MTEARVTVPPATLALVLVLLSCNGGETGPAPAPEIAFVTRLLELDTDRSGQVVVRNAGGVAAGPVLVLPEPVTSAGGAAAVGVSLTTSPGEIPTLNPGDQVAVQVTVAGAASAPPGDYGGALRIQVDGLVLDRAEIRFRVESLPVQEGVGAIELVEPPGRVRQGDVAAFRVVVRDEDGAEIESPIVRWSVTPEGSGAVHEGGSFVGYAAGTATVAVESGGMVASADVEIAPRGLSGGFTVLGRGEVTDRFTSDLWLFGDHGYTGTWSTRTGPGGVSRPGNTLYAWDISDPTRPVRTDSVVVDARTVNDVKVSADGALAVLSREASNAGTMGITILDLSDPAHPSVVTDFTDATFIPGIHNVWIEGDYVYLAVDGAAADRGLRVVDLRDPAAPAIVASFHAGSSFLHDVYVRDGLAFLSHWDAGLVILDVGNGIRGGSPSSPVEVSRIGLDGNTHNAWYWPETGYVFVGEEDFSKPGIMHVVDASDLTDPRRVASFRVQGTTPHNFWLDEDRGILYSAWYEQGLHALDVTGELLGPLDRQGREIASVRYAPDTRTWAPQLHRGVVWVSDINSGLVALRPGSNER